MIRKPYPTQLPIYKYIDLTRRPGNHRNKMCTSSRQTVNQKWKLDSLAFVLLKNCLDSITQFETSGGSVKTEDRRRIDETKEIE